VAEQEIFEAKVATSSFPPRLSGNKLALRYKVNSSDLNQSTPWSPVYYIDGPTRVNATANTINGSGTKITIDWKDTNVCNYDLFVSYPIELVMYPARVNSVGFVKTIYFLSAEAQSAFIPEELANFKVGDLIDVVSINASLNGVDMTVTDVNLDSANLPYYIQYTGDSSNNTANTNTTNGYFGIAANATSEQNSRHYGYLAKYPLTGEEEKTYTFQSAISKNGVSRYEIVKAIVQIEGVDKSIDPSLEIAKTIVDVF
jgi:hypothetical protein